MAETLHARVLHLWLIIRVESFPLTSYLLAAIHPLQTTDESQTDE